jgi:8-oxo-dGTP pyrophosphatase MutT (NUDIX family)
MNTTWGSDDVTFDGSKPVKEEPKKSEAEKDVQNEIPAIQKPEHEVIFEHPYIKVKSNKGYVYSERKGVDSVAFILLANNASDERRVGLIREFKPPLDDFIITAFGGSVENKGQDLRKLVISEVMEEAGFSVSESDVHAYGRVLVSTQSNQMCYLFAVEVDKMKQGERTTTDPLEKKSSVVWITLPEAIKLEDWKAPTIITKRLAERNSYAVVRT